jgi:hypothetical protein
MGSRASVQPGPPDRVTVTFRASAADWRGFYAAALRAWQPAGDCWQRQHPISGKTARLCIQPGANSAVIEITEQ